MFKGFKAEVIMIHIWFTCLQCVIVDVEIGILTAFLFVPSELPGFYFDPEKNRYFRLLPGHNNCNPLTREQLQEKEREKRRHEMLAEDDKLRKVCLVFGAVGILHK